MGLRYDNTLFPVYLFFASIANVIFLYIAARDLSQGKSDRASSWVILSLAVAELLWCVPCWLQCLARMISDDGDYWWIPNAPSYSVGCDLMGFYSIFASVSGMLLVLVIALMSYCSLVIKEKLTVQNTLILIVVAYGVALLECMFPIFGVGSFRYSGEGFCYIDWSDLGQAICMEIVTYPAFIVTSYLFACCAMHKEEPEGEGLGMSVTKRPCWWWSLFAVSYMSAWVLWIPAIFIGQDNSQPYPKMFPEGYMVSGGALGHLQAVLNPLLYGILWRSWYQAGQLAAVTPEKPDHTQLKEDVQASAVVESVDNAEYIKAPDAKVEAERECCNAV